VDDLKILYDDGDVAAFHKPSGLLVHRSPIDRRETRFALQMARDLLGRHVFPVHRLDKPTSGVLLFGLSTESAHLLCEAFAAGDVDKRYLAVVRGWPPEEGIIDYPLAEVEDRRLGATVGGAPQEAVTHFRRLATAEVPVSVGPHPTSRYALLEASPRTGRRHQIRRHFKHLFHPLVGDTRYGEGRHNRFFREHFGCNRLLLAATAIRFPHPRDQRPVTITTPLCPAFASVIEQLGWREAIQSNPF
jgi:tRNA pseudouridine65 synthase